MPVMPVTLSRSPVFWLCSLLASLALLCWRVFDYLDEGAHHDYHMTRFGLSIHGLQAEGIQLGIIAGCALAVSLCLWQLWRLAPRPDHRLLGAG